MHSESVVMMLMVYVHRLLNLLQFCCAVNRVQHMPIVKPLEKDQPSVEQILAHLDHMRSACKDISCVWFVLLTLKTSVTGLVGRTESFKSILCTLFAGSY